MRHHETSLVLFTAGSTAGAGLVAAGPLAGLLGVPVGAWTTTAGAALLGIALGVSLFHLGRPRRLLLAAKGITTSPVSQEVLVANLTLAAAGGEVLARHLDVTMAVVPLRVAAAGLAAAFLLALGRVYRLPGQAMWNVALSFRPLLLGLAWGLVFCLVAGTGPGFAIPVALGLLLVDTGIARLRWKSALGSETSGTKTHPVLWARRKEILATRLVLADVGPAALLATGFMVPAAVLLALGLLADRFAFYALAVQTTTEGEIQRVERLL